MSARPVGTVGAAARPPARRRVAWSAATALFLLHLLAAHAVAQRPAERFVLVGCGGLTADGLRDPSLPNLAALARAGRVALMSNSVAGPRTPTAAAFTLALGAREPAEPGDGDVYAAGEPVERATAGVVYMRRTGLRAGSGSSSLVHLGIASLRRRGLADATVGGMLARAGRGGAIAFATDASPGQRALGLLATDAYGVGTGTVVPPGAGAPAALAAWAARQPGSAAVWLAGGAPALDAFIGALPAANDRVLVVSVYPPSDPDGRWRRLTPVVLAGKGVGTGLLTSATTRTPGLVSNVDVAPTLLDWLGVRVPAGSAGHALTLAPEGDPLAAVARLDRAVRLNAVAEDPLEIGLGAAALLVAAGGLAATVWRPRLARVLAAGLLVAMNLPLGMLLAVALSFGRWSPLDAVLPAWRVPAYGGCMVAAMAVCAALEYAVGRRVQPPVAAAALTCAVIVVDAVTGQSLVRLALLSSYQLPGIRFYGVGNEYAGIAIGMALVAAFLAPRAEAWQVILPPGPPASPAEPAGTGHGGRPGISRRSQGAAVLAFAAVALTIGLPRLGANAGGLIAAVVGFGIALRTLAGRTAGWRAACLLAAAGLAGAFALAMADRWLSAGAPSHMGGALDAAGSQGWQYLAQVALRKELMNLRIVVHPAVLASVAVVAALAALAGSAMRAAFAGLLERHPGWARGLPAVGWGALAAFLFNDSGVVAAAFIVGAFLAAGLWLVFTDAAERASGG